MPSEPVTLVEARQLALLQAQTELKPGSYRRYEVLLRNFVQFAQVVGGTSSPDDVSGELVHRFVNARIRGRPPSAGTTRTRKAAVRYLYRVLRREGLVAHDPTLDLQLLKDTHTVFVLTDELVERCRFAATTALSASDRYTATLAVLEAGASPGEAGCLAWTAVADDGETFAVEDRNGRTRRLATTNWGADVLRRARPMASSEFVCVLRSTTYDSRRTSVTHVLREIYERAGVAQAEPRSVTAWCARRVFDETGSIEAAARIIGFESLDRTAQLIGHDWNPG